MVGMGELLKSTYYNALDEIGMRTSHSGVVENKKRVSKVIRKDPFT